MSAAAPVTELVFETTPVYGKIDRSTARIVANQGGTRSSKTYSLAQKFINMMLTEENLIISCVRKTMPALRATAMRDFFEILEKMGLYDERHHNKSENIYHLGSSEMEFFSCDQASKIRGRKRHHLWPNEANELTLEDWRQLVLRTEGRIFLDYNPSDEYHWLYDQVLTRHDCEFIQSTYKDNTFLSQTLIDEIELLKATDENYWNIFGLGNRGVSGTTIYTHWKLIDYFTSLPVKDECYGLDFGFNHPTALTKVGFLDLGHVWDEVVYQRHLTTDDLIDLMKQKLVPFNASIYADAAEPKTIETIRRAGYKMIQPADKDVKLGIKKVKSSPLYITKDSPNLLKEVKAYKWKTNLATGIILDEPVKFNDDGMDAGRYGTFTHTWNVRPATHTRTVAPRGGGVRRPL